MHETITLHVPGYDDCDQATLLGIIRDALTNTERGQDFTRSRSPITATTTPVHSPEPYTTTLSAGAYEGPRQTMTGRVLWP